MEELNVIFFILKFKNFLINLILKWVSNLSLHKLETLYKLFISLVYKSDEMYTLERFDLISSTEYNILGFVAHSNLNALITKPLRNNKTGNLKVGCFFCKSPFTAMILPGYQNSDSASSSKFHPWPCLPCLWR